MHITTTTVKGLGNLHAKELLKCERPYNEIAYILVTKLIITIMVLGGSIRAVAEQSISQYNPNHPLIIARQEAIKAGIDPKLVLAIMAHESNDCKLPTTAHTDLGCMQISRSTAAALGLDQHRLVSDRTYNIKAGIVILAQFKHYSRNDRLWWTKYNIGYQNLPVTKASYAAKVGYNGK